MSSVRFLPVFFITILLLYGAFVFYLSVSFNCLLNKPELNSSTSPAISMSNLNLTNQVASMSTRRLFQIALMHQLEEYSFSPFLNGDAFKEIADFLYDRRTSRSWRPADISQNSIIFVHSDLLKDFFKRVDPQIKNQYILISHNSDIEISKEEFGEFVDSSKSLKFWFCINKGFENSKLVAIPIGLPNIRTVSISEISQIALAAPRWDDKVERFIWLYVNFEMEELDRIGRKKIFNQSLGITGVVAEEKRISQEQYYKKLSKSQFVLSPFGNGKDCYRTWEALYFGAVPIVQRTYFSEELYRDLPVLVLDDWNDLSDQLLQDFAVRFLRAHALQWNYDILWNSYWKNKIRLSMLL